MKNKNNATGPIIEAGTPDPEIQPKDCLGIEHSDPKLVPALFNLYLNDGLPDPFHIVGCGRTKLNDQQFREKMETALMAKGIMNDSKWQAFSDVLHYRSVDYGDLGSFTNLAKFLRELDQKNNTRGNKIFYLALPPSLYKP
ncbi:MAG: glucose-6-phosphate dehydrogenase, partial [Deltaproteobacteria bacterium]|nr:glucose-6-phosphate dehydrogenase [Deltaproteobacteria bacterium]